MLKLFTSVALLLFSQILLLTGHGMQLTLLPLRAELEGFTLTEIGMTGTAYFVGFAAGCVATPLIARRARFYICAADDMVGELLDIALIHPSTTHSSFFPFHVIHLQSIYTQHSI